MENKIEKITFELEKVAYENDVEARERVAELCSELINDNFSYENLPSKIMDLIDNLHVMDEINGVKEPAILHMKEEEAERILLKLRKLKIK